MGRKGKKSEFTVSPFRMREFPLLSGIRGQAPPAFEIPRITAVESAPGHGSGYRCRDDTRETGQMEGKDFPSRRIRDPEAGLHFREIPIRLKTLLPPREEIRRGRPRPPFVPNPMERKRRRLPGE